MSKDLFIDVIKEMPLHSRCFIQTPHEEFLNAIKHIEFKEEDIFLTFLLTETTKSILIDAGLKDAQEYIHLLKIKNNNQMLFEAYDGIEYGVISKRYSIVNSQLKKYVDEGDLLISSSW